MGLHAITQKGMIFHFLRLPLDNIQAKRDRITNAIAGTGSEIVDLMRSIRHMNDSGEYNNAIINKKEARLEELKEYAKDNPRKYDVILYIFKPIILCPTCMASVHTLVWFPIFQGSYTLDIIPAMLIGAFFNMVLTRAANKLK